MWKGTALMAVPFFWLRTGKGMGGRGEWNLHEGGEGRVSEVGGIWKRLGRTAEFRLPNME
jgi:hypothetical protein